MTAQEIQQRMAAIRAHLSDDLQEIHDSSETLLDWRYYFKRYPWPMMSAAAAVGYFIVPKRLHVRADRRMLAALAKEQQRTTNQQSEKTEKGLMAVALGLAANALVRAGTAYAGQQASKYLGRFSARTEAPEAPNRGHPPL